MRIIEKIIDKQQFLDNPINTEESMKKSWEKKFGKMDKKFKFRIMDDENGKIKIICERYGR